MKPKSGLEALTRSRRKGKKPADLEPESGDSTRSLLDDAFPALDDDEDLDFDAEVPETVREERKLSNEMIDRFLRRPLLK